MNALLPLILLAVVFLLLVVVPARRQMRTARAAQAMRAALTVDTDVMTTSGLHGRVVQLDERTADLEIAPGVVVTFARAAIGEVLSGTPDQGIGEATTEDEAPDGGYEGGGYNDEGRAYGDPETKPDNPRE
ncbi:MAG TPA: preprotein translocase subunit YajC [Mycobacteriales bacterium]